MKIRWGTLKHTIEQLKAKEKNWTERENMNHHIQRPLNKSHRTYQKIQGIEWNRLMYIAQRNEKKNHLNWNSINGKPFAILRNKLKASSQISNRNIFIPISSIF